ncbi:hypothetical protein [Micromonospora sp. NPDC051296]|uniref:hypothetical protein n=1 Tax=Micromonospora sp. NPDC051296 TaxID=3155046 RepID=UPI003442310A
MRESDWVPSAGMRMVYTSAPDDVFIPGRDRLVRRFERWARRQRRPVDPFTVEALLDHRWADGDGLLSRWQPEDLEEALLDWFPRRCADQHLLHGLLDKLGAPFAEAMADQRRYGLAKFWATRMVDEGVDPYGPCRH